MTLQYRRPAQDIDRAWEPRLTLASRFLSGIIDAWCRSDADFPVGQTVAVLMRLFSPHFSAHSTHDCWKRSAADWLALVDTPEDEFAKAWPHRSAADQEHLIGSLQSILLSAEEFWAKRGTQEPTVGQLIQSAVDELVAGRYVSIRHYESMRRR